MSHASELRIFFAFSHSKSAIFFLYSFGTSDTLSQKHFQVSNYICMQFPFMAL